MLYGIWQGGCWWDEKINKGDFVSCKAPAGRPVVPLSSSNGLIKENSNRQEKPPTLCERRCRRCFEVFFKDFFKDVNDVEQTAGKTFQNNLLSFKDRRSY